ncbi:hypothetical protein PQJ75_04880 [Rhodoplanes sp. TEM]|uniref:Uncharacterized protein n=1 Tax=Rhodoplanes tepidamans TaxID=200616 RepID=A0ABT5JDB7_RHOTP|nr:MULTISPECIES: cytochrome oxidase putative small subunit CydP [Rhodoplanes]MDC7787681.1 hypothetical protein [Rhodoplanes tepidamans]MDC7983055.1 hypothetical protein [Rhodoplanes sp. TEM]MDQ0356437.1 hypothetical protein [Rhodoplanes tepidamans]
MTGRDLRLRNELVALVVLKIGVLVLLWLVFVHGARVPVDAAAAARHAVAEPSLSPTGAPHGL